MLRRCFFQDASKHHNTHDLESRNSAKLFHCARSSSKYARTPFMHRIRLGNFEANAVHKQDGNLRIFSEWHENIDIFRSWHLHFLGFFWMCAVLRWDISFCSSSNLCMHALHFRESPVIFFPFFLHISAAMLNSSTGFLCLHRLFWQVQKPTSRGPNLQLLQTIFLEPRGRSQAVSGKSYLPFSFLHL